MLLRFSVVFVLLCIIGCTNDETETNLDVKLPVTFFRIGGEDLIANPIKGVCLMGGRTENDNASRWFLERANGGDVLVLRASGSDGYNDYFYNELGIPVNSVETLVFSGKTEDRTIIERINKAEAIWFAGGDQSTYLEYWKNTLIQHALQNAIDRGVVIGGTSAGMAILGEYIWTGERIENDFLQITNLNNIITDSHFSERNRLPRLQGFIEDTGARGIGVDEYTAVCINGNGLAKVFGELNEDDYAFFINVDLKEYKIKGLPEGEHTFNLNTWSSE